eukprot:12285698-Karenia_brevis.AAC.1
MWGGRSWIRLAYYFLIGSKNFVRDAENVAMSGTCDPEDVVQSAPCDSIARDSPLQAIQRRAAHPAPSFARWC